VSKIKGVKVECSDEGVGEGKRVLILGKRRCLAVPTVEGVLPPFKLSIKKESIEESLDMRKKAAFVVTAHEAKCVDIAFNRQTAERGVFISRKVLSECENTIVDTETRLAESSEKHTLLSSRVSSLGSLLGSMTEQLNRMKDGGSHTFWPRPVSNNPEMPLSRNHILNACPVCGFWYICFNFASTLFPWGVDTHTIHFAYQST